MLNGGAVSWKSTKQNSVSLSTAEAEWYAASEAGKEVMYLCAILEKLGFTQREPTELYEDSRAVRRDCLFLHLRDTKQKC